MGKTRKTMVKHLGLIIIVCLYSCANNQFDNKHVEYYNGKRMKSVEFWNNSDEEREFYQFNEEGDTTVISKTIGNHKGIARFYNDTILYTFNITNSDFVYEFLLSVGGKVLTNESLYTFLQKKNDGIYLEVLGDEWDRFDLVAFDLADTSLAHGDTMRFDSNLIYVPNTLIKGKRLLGLPTKITQNTENGSYSKKVYEIYLNIPIKQEFQDFYDIQKLF
jgi:hypothetical protein